MMANKTQRGGVEKSPTLNPAQKAAAEAPFSPLLIVAGAGTGKTRTLISRIAYLIERGIPPHKICAITFTNKAAKEMADRTHLMIGSKKGPFIGTFHSLGARILREECRVLERKPNFTIFDDHDSFNLVKKAVKAVLPKSEAIGAEKKKEAPAMFAQEISKIKNMAGIDPVGRPQKNKNPRFEKNQTNRMENMNSHRSLSSSTIEGEDDGGDGKHHGSSAATDDDKDEKSAATHSIFRKYEAALIENNAFDFDDLIEKTVAALKTYPDILEKYQSRYDAILVDEYQDINPRQYELVRLLAQKHGNVSVVGDDEQTIYSWRYADIGLFLNFEKHWPGANVFFLEENYRSTGNIINAAGAVVKNNRFRAPKTLWTKNTPGAAIKLFEAWGENEEAEWIAREIQNEKRHSYVIPALDHGRGQAEAEIHVLKVKNESVTVLYRTNAQSRAIEQALIRHNIPYRIFGGLKFYERREVKDIVAALRYASNPHDAPSRERLEKNLSKKKFAEFKSALAKAGNMKPQEIIALFMETFHYFDYLKEYFMNADEREGNIAELIAFASEFENLSELLEKIMLLQVADDENKNNGKERGSSPETVNLMTIHLAKGLEFDTVFIAGASEGLLPHGRSLREERSLEEERRLMYVAMTRARKNLAISFYGDPSRFIGEIPGEYVALQNSAAGATDFTDTNSAADVGYGRNFEEEDYIEF